MGWLKTNKKKQKESPASEAALKDDATIETKAATPPPKSSKKDPSTKRNGNASKKKVVKFPVKKDEKVETKVTAPQPPSSKKDPSTKKNGDDLNKKVVKFPVKKHATTETTVSAPPPPSSKKYPSVDTNGKHLIKKNVKFPVKSDAKIESKGTMKDTKSEVNNRSTVTVAKAYQVPANKTSEKIKTTGDAQAYKAPVKETPVKEAPVKEDAKTRTNSAAQCYKAPVKEGINGATKNLGGKPKPKSIASDRAKAVGGTRIFIKASAVDAIKNPKPSFQQRRLARKPSNDSVDSDDGSAVISRSTKWIWKEGSLVDSSGSNITISLDGEEPLILPATAMRGGDVVLANEYKMSKDGRPICPDDLISLAHLHEPSVVECLGHRYEDNRIYTSTGPILLALNPFKHITGLYEDSIMKKYWGKAKDLPPHIYSIADNAFLTMMKALEATMVDKAPVGCDQSILVSGESGAGKTVTTKFAMKYLAALSQRAKITKDTVFDSSESKGMNISRKSISRMSSRLDVMSQHSQGSTESIETQVLQSNPILESFGNARTVRNDNSSRFGKFIEMQFTRKGRLVGASIEVYLLEKVRLVKTSLGERNYHVFYEMLDGDMNGSERDSYFIDRLAKPEDFKLTATGTYTRRDGVTDDETYDDLLLAMHSMEFAQDEQRNIFTTVAAILHASNLTFLDIDHKSKLDDKNKHLQPVCNLLGVTPEDLSRALCHATISAGRQTLQKDLTVDKAIKGLEALLKATYGTLFTYLVTRINEKISYKRKCDENTGTPIDNPAKDSAACIGVLDIFGFESFKTNSFEQLCINYCNEALQQQFNTFVLENEQAEYEREGINWSFIKFPGNQDVLDLIGKRGSGLLGILDDQCKTPGTTDKSFALALYRNCKSHVRFGADRTQTANLKFSVHHYAGAVEYSTDDFMEKNRDELPKEATELLQNSSNPFIRHLAGMIECGQEKDSTKATKNKAKKTKETVGGEFRRQLLHLREKIDRMTPHYVRCLKPNDQLVQNRFDRAAIVEQLRCNGIIEALRVARAGFSNQFSHADFVRRYNSCVWKELKIRRVRPRKARGSSPKNKKRAGPRVISSKECSNLLKLLCKKFKEGTEDEDNDGKDDDDEDDKEKNIFKKKAKKTDDLSSELQKVGMQFGKTKVFVRHTAFEKLERIRTQEHARAAVKLNSVFRMFLTRTAYGHVRNLAHEARLKALADENPEWGDPTFGKESLERYEKNREAFSGKSGQKRNDQKTSKPFDWVVENGVWKKKYLE